jgi:hypothetical protein
LSIWIFESIIKNSWGLILFHRNLFVSSWNIYSISWNKFRFFHSVFSGMRLMMFVRILRSYHHHHSLHELHITHLIVFAHTHNGGSFAFWMFISAILTSAASSKFAFYVRVEKQTFFTVWAGRKVFALFCWVNKRTIFVILATREEFASNLFFCYLFCF